VAAGSLLPGRLGETSIANPAVVAGGSGEVRVFLVTLPAAA